MEKMILFICPMHTWILLYVPYTPQEQETKLEFKTPGKLILQNFTFSLSRSIVLTYTVLFL